MLMTETDAVQLLERSAYDHRKNFVVLDYFLEHSYNTAKIAEETAKKLGLNSEEIFLSGLFHDIGRCFSPDREGHTFHEIFGARYVEGQGVSLGIGSQAECDRIAQSFRSHFLVFEQFGMDEYSHWLPGLRDTNPDLLLPQSWNEIIIVYADLTNLGTKRVDFEERLANIKKRDKLAGNPRLKVAEEAESRLFTLKKDLEEALQESKVDLTKYALL